MKAPSPSPTPSSPPAKTFMPIESLFEKTGKFDGWLFEEEPCGNNGWSGR